MNGEEDGEGEKEEEREKDIFNICHLTSKIFHDIFYLFCDISTA